MPGARRPPVGARIGLKPASAFFLSRVAEMIADTLVQEFKTGECDVPVTAGTIPIADMLSQASAAVAVRHPVEQVAEALAP
jgi:hypothetical protein